MSPVAGTRYGYLTAPWDAPLSLGVQSPIEFNGLMINDRYQSDRILVTSITGLDGPDVSDVREVIPGDDGEIAYASPYRGRSFILTGVIQAGSLATSTALGRDLRAAFAPLVEAPMKFRWFDVTDNFEDTNTLSNYTATLGSTSSLSISGASLRVGSTTPTILMRTSDNRVYGDVQVTAGFMVGDLNSSSKMGVIIAYVDSTNYLVARWYTASTPAIQIVSVVAGVETVIASTNVSAETFGIYWLRGRREGDLVTVELWNASPTESTLPTWSAQGWLTGSDSNSYGDSVLSNVGLEFRPQATTWGVDDFVIESLYPGDISFMAKTITKPSIQDAQQKMTRFERPFQLTLRSSWPYAQSAHQLRSPILVPSAGNTTQLGFSSPISNPLSALSIIPGSVSLQNNIIFVNNRGTAPERPVIVVYGATNAFAIYNLTNNMQLSWGGSTSTLPDGSQLIFDCQNRTLVDQTGANQKSALSYSDTRWMILEPGWNDLYFVGSNYSTNTKIVVYTHHRWI